MIEYKVLKELGTDPDQTQRKLAKKLDISLGKVNYVISGLIEKGIIKANKIKKNPHKTRWRYVLTPKGMKEKVAITKRYLKKRMRDYERVKREVEELRREVGEQGC